MTAATNDSIVVTRPDNYITLYTSSILYFFSRDSIEMLAFDKRSPMLLVFRTNDNRRRLHYVIVERTDDTGRAWNEIDFYDIYRSWQCENKFLNSPLFQKSVLAKFIALEVTFGPLVKQFKMLQLFILTILRYLKWQI